MSTDFRPGGAWLPRRWTLALVLGSALVFAAAVASVALAGVVVLRAWVHAFTAIAFIALGVLTLAAARRKPGVGLSIVRRAVELHGGKVWAEASPGQGACFNFTLPKAS